jgi:addiction module HigA family antidote
MLKRNLERKPSLPGEILHELYLKRNGITIKSFAEAIGCTPKHISNVIHGKARIEAELATKIAAVLGTTIEIWLNLQNTTDVWNARQKMRDWKPKRTFHITAEA